MTLTISISAGPDAPSSTVAATGSEQHIVTIFERDAFGISDDNLQNAAARLLGGLPDNVFVSDPNPWNIYQTQGWPPVQTKLTIQSATITSVSGSPEALASQQLKNDSSAPAQLSASVTQQVSIGTKSSWSLPEGLQMTLPISYEIDFLAAAAPGETALSFTEIWGIPDAQSETVTLGNRAGVAVTLQPGESVEAVLQATGAAMQVEIVYLLTLSGYVVANYTNALNGHHFWYVDVNSAIQALGQPASITVTHTLEIDYHANAQIVVKDPSGKLAGTFAMGAAPAA